MSVEEISASCHIKPEAARLARQREYDEPFEILGDRSRQLFQAIEERKKRWTRGRRFYHILGVNDKAHCVNLLSYFYRRTKGDVTTVGIGSGMNDAAFLNCVDIALVLGSSRGTPMKAVVPHGRFYLQGGPKVWNTAVMKILKADPANTLQPEEEGLIHSNSLGATAF
jgi:mannosyl-3-phosphoglycerate phosphatase